MTLSDGWNPILEHLKIEFRCLGLYSIDIETHFADETYTVSVWASQSSDRNWSSKNYFPGEKITARGIRGEVLPLLETKLRLLLP